MRLIPLAADAVGRLYRNRALALALARREVTDRYTRQVLGSAWAVGHPLIHVGVYVFLFQVVLKLRVGGTAEMPLGYVAYLLSGLIPWLAVQEALNKGSTVITAQANLVKQVVFPIDVLPVKSVLACLVTQVVGTLGLTAYVLADQGRLPATYALLPALWAVQAAGMAGVVYAVSAVAVYVRDVKELVQVFAVVGMYLVPIAYLPEMVPDRLRPLLAANPFSHLVWCYQDVCYYGRFEHPWSWVVFPAAAGLAFVLGYGLFRKLQAHFGSVL